MYDRTNYKKSTVQNISVKERSLNVLRNNVKRQFLKKLKKPFLKHKKYITRKLLNY